MIHGDPRNFAKPFLLNIEFNFTSTVRFVTHVAEWAQNLKLKVYLAYAVIFPRIVIYYYHNVKLKRIKGGDVH